MGGSGTSLVGITNTDGDLYSTGGMWGFSYDGEANFNSIYVGANSWFAAGNVIISLDGQITATSYVKQDGNASQSLQGDGSVKTLDNGTYTPTITDVTNIGSSSVASDAVYTIVGNVVTLSLRLQIQPAASGLITELDFTLPTNSVLGTVTGIVNGGLHQITRGVATINISNSNKARLYFKSNDNSGTTHYIVLNYIKP